MRSAALAALLLCLPASAMASTIVVGPGNSNWVFSNTDNHGTDASGGFVAGPGTPPLGAGSAEFIVGNSSSSEILADPFLDNGMSVGDFTGLSYAAYRSSPSGGVTLPALDIAVSFDGGAKYDGRFVYEPYLSIGGANTTSDTWQTWDAMSGNGWYYSRAAGANPPCPMGAPCTFDELLAAYPNATVDGGLLFKAGSGWSSFDGNVDDFDVTTLSGGSTTYDFEPVP